MKIVLGTDEVFRIDPGPQYMTVWLVDAGMMQIPVTQYNFEKKSCNEARLRDADSDYAEAYSEHFREFHRIPPEAVRTATHRGSELGYDIYHYEWYEITSTGRRVSDSDDEGGYAARQSEFRHRLGVHGGPVPTKVDVPPSLAELLDDANRKVDEDG